MSESTEHNPRNDSTRGREGRERDWRHLSTLFEKLPPHAIEAEMSLLGSMLIDPQVIGDVVMAIGGGDDFFKPANGVIYQSMVELYDRTSALDLVQLNQLLVDRGALAAVGGLDYLVDLANAVPTAANAMYYARLVRDKALIRRLIDVAGDILYDAYNSPEDAQGILEVSEQSIFALAQHHDRGTGESLQDLLKLTMARLEANEGKELSGLATGFVELDQLTSGLQAGEMIVLAARPSMGKTALALNLAEQVAMQGRPVGVFSLEMGRQQLVQRLLCARSGIDSHRLRRNMLRSEDFRALMAACDELMHAPVYIDDTPGLSMLQLRAKARRLKQKHGIEAVIIDYLQLMSSGRRAENRQVEVAEMSRAVKAMARELDVPVICLSQLNRASEDRTGHRPRMSDLRESGSIEQDADVVMMLHREEYYHLGDEEWMETHHEKVGTAELIIAKQRNGPTGTVKLTWDSHATRFRDFSDAAPPVGVYYESKEPAAAFAERAATGPVREFRDGGGPDRDDLEDEIPI
ncbi:MAG: replicative DNA helicase [Planctomycetota bacterium]|jgi:replicative DNA helicase